MKKYYSTQRPIMPGTFPGGHRIEEVENFDNRMFVEEIGRAAWGYIVFRDELTEKEMREYELVEVQA